MSGANWVSDLGRRTWQALCHRDPGTPPQDKQPGSPRYPRTQAHLCPSLSLCILLREMGIMIASTSRGEREGLSVRCGSSTEKDAQLRAGAGLAPVLLLGRGSRVPRTSEPGKQVAIWASVPGLGMETLEQGKASSGSEAAAMSGALPSRAPSVGGPHSPGCLRWPPEAQPVASGLNSPRRALPFPQTSRES